MFPITPWSENLSRKYLALEYRMAFNEEGFAPEWTNVVPNWAICNWFYAFFIVNVSIFVIAAIFSFYTLKATKNINVKNPITLSVLLTLAISGTNTLFFYLMCDRALDA